MALFTEKQLIERAEAASTIRKSVQASESRALTLDSVGGAKYDIFLSHSFTDKRLAEGVRMTLKDLGFSVYVDWIEDGELSRDEVTADTAEVLRRRLKNSKCLFFATTVNSAGSMWMPWELGYMDGFNGRAAILPVAKTTTGSYAGQEYLGIYPYIQQALQEGTDKRRLWVHRTPTNYIVFDSWLEGKEPTERKPGKA